MPSYTPAQIVAAFKMLKAQNEHADSDALIEEIAIRFYRDTKTVKKLVIRFAVLDQNPKPPSRRYTLNDDCFIRIDGRVINNCRELTGETRHHKPWMNVERQCLLCSMENHRNGDNVDEVCEDLAPYFDRTPAAIAQEYYRLNGDK